MTGTQGAATAGAVVVAAVVSIVLAEGCRRVALRYGVTDNPAAHKAHRSPTPYLGGVALVVATLVPAFAVGAMFGGSGSMVLLAVSAASVAAIGLADDVIPLGLGSRLGVEAVAAALVVLGGTRLALTGHAWLDTGLTVAWIVLLTNSFNLLDNMDAVAASMAGTSAVVLGCAALTFAAGPTATLLLCLAGGCAGFLVHNRPPARIFMGDAGSLFVGFLIAVGTVAVAPAGPLPAVTVLLLVAFGALVDTGLVVVSRRIAGRSWRTGGTDHASHRLRRLGLNANQVAAVLVVTVAVFGVLGVLVRNESVPVGYGLAVAGAGWLASVVLLLRIPGYPADRPSDRRTTVL